MKKLGLFALIAVLFTACSQDNTTDNALQPELLRVGFEEGTRVQLNDQHQTVWNTGDMVSVFYKSDANSCYSYTGEDKARTGVISKVDNVATTSASLDKVYAVYPYNADYTIDTQGVVSATVSANQTYAAGSYGIGNNIMVATGGSAELRFQNVYGWVRLQFTGKDSVSKLVFRGNNNEVLAGAATINPNDATIAFAAGGATELTLDCSNVTLTDAATEFYIAVAPQAFEKGFEVEAHTAAGVKVFNKGTATTITRNVVTTMATTEIDVITPISDVTTAGTYAVTGTVVAVGTQAYIIADNTGAMMVYHYNNGRTVGENITISGEVTIYHKADGTSWGTPQFSNAATVVVNSTNNAWTYNPSVLDAAGVDAMLTETLSKEVEFAGKLVVSGNYINIEIAGATVQGSVKYVDNNAYADLNGKNVTVKGYFVGVSSKKYVNVLPYSIEAKESVNPEPEPSATIIDAVANVKAGKYYMAGYAEQYNNSSNGTVTTFAPYSYHMWTGGISTGSNFDLLTVNYSYENEKFTLNPDLSEQDAAKGTAQLVELVAVDGKTNAYYIKMGDKYLSCPAKRKAALVDTPTEWAFTDHAKGGICLTDVANNVILGTAGATYNMLRCYVAPATSLLYGVAFISADAAFDSTTPTPDPDPDPEPEPSVKALPYTESFKTSQGDFTINDVELGSLSYVWKHSTYNDSGYMKASAFKTAAVASESWLISPAISLSDATSPVVTFSHAHKFAGTPSNELTLWVSANDGAWEQLTIPTYSSNADWTFVESGEISLAKYVGSTIKVAFKYVSSTSAAATWEVKDFSVAEGSGSVTPDPEPEPEPSATIIDAVANVKAGKYYMAGYAEQYNNSSNGTVTTFAPYSYHMWTGGISTGSNFDLLTVNYSYENEKFTLNPDLSEQDAAKGTAQLVELVAVDGKTNAYYIKMGDKYLSCPAKRKAALVDTPTEWAFTDHAKGGICLTDVANNVILGTAGATYNMLRCYVAPATSLLYGVAFISADAAFDSTTPTPDPEPEPEPDPTPGDTVAINTITTAGTYAVTGTVVAVGTQAYIIADNTGAMMVYHYNNGRTVGENITISGEVTIYHKADGTSWGTPQFSNAATVVVNSTNNAWTYNPSVLDAAGVDAMLTETLSKEVEFAGKLVVSGNYINIEIAGATVQGSVKYVDNNAYADLNGKNVTVKGYFVGVSSKKYVNVLPYSIEAKESVNPEPEPEPEPTPDSNGIVWEIGLDLQSWNTDTNATYGAGFIASDDNISVGYYQHKSTSKAVEPKTDHIRIYKSSALVITPLNGKTIKKVVIDVTYASTYALDMNVLSDGTTAVGDTTAGTITWSGSTDQFVAEANNGQVRVKKLTVITE